MKEKPIFVTFANPKIEKSFEKLRRGTFEEKQLNTFIIRAIIDIKTNPTCGIRIPKKLWPKTYIQQYKITNLWKYDLPNAWRLMYKILEGENFISLDEL